MSSKKDEIKWATGKIVHKPLIHKAFPIEKKVVKCYVCPLILSDHDKIRAQVPLFP